MKRSHRRVLSHCVLPARGVERPYEAEVCNVCGDRHYRIVHHFPTWTLGREPVANVSIVRCNRCSIRRRLPAIVDDYEQHYHAPYVEQGAAIHPHQLGHFSDLMTARLRDLGGSPGRLLDVGCSTGRVLGLARLLGYETVGLDYSAWASEYCARLGYETRNGSLVGQWTEGEQFDVIHCSHTIEHVPDPLAYLVEMHYLLKCGGHVMLALPNYASVPRLMLKEKWPVWCLDSHLWQFTSIQMCRLLEAVGFDVVSCRTMHGYTPDSVLKKRLLDFSAALGFGDACNLVARKR